MKKLCKELLKVAYRHIGRIIVFIRVLKDTNLHSHSRHICQLLNLVVSSVTAGAYINPPPPPCVSVIDLLTWQERYQLEAVSNPIIAQRLGCGGGGDGGGGGGGDPPTPPPTKNKWTKKQTNTYTKFAFYCFNNCAKMSLSPPPPPPTLIWKVYSDFKKPCVLCNKNWSRYSAKKLNWNYNSESYETAIWQRN